MQDFSCMREYRFVRRGWDDRDIFCGMDGGVTLTFAKDEGAHSATCDRHVGQLH